MHAPAPMGHMTAEALQQYLATHREGSYELVDVRQPVEFRHGHIPGAHLLPLPEFVHLLETGAALPFPADRTIIFYCHSGNRSRVAARQMLASNRGGGAVYSLDGGMLAWTGTALEGIPRLEALPLHAPLKTMLLAALDMEKAALTLYTALDTEARRAGRPGEGCQADPLTAQLVDMESAHARQVYQVLVGQWGEGSPPDFETLFKKAGGDVLEGGRKLDELAPWVAKAMALEDGCLSVIELGLEVEYAAHDLYRAVARQARTLPGLSEADAAAMETIFLDLAQQEKQHARFLLERLERLAVA
ncbi:rhodanese-like domain-containing protein [Megalodesulfovibrio gigas]|uniref:Putative rhodanese-like domain-containing protein n=1 Tax=Megalodesulfovibrio gigas (strain ATCC 19364 / DSM 1382 / NCIMB 9332 / VKM B-1759) TaxID=1121448 RepID=T2G9R5_MEGG1|nr:rhodanese-like domain-containing protein [Megalodesulfovibrio gigas]AGW13335.1 putative rhodanese-like domain-containing protein [Megalodesulfovibrio gigas DSM 1382 = ATCC 19364]